MASAFPQPHSRSPVHTVNPVYVRSLTALLTLDAMAIIYALIVHSYKPLAVLLFLAAICGVVVPMLKRIRLTMNESGIEQTGLSGHSSVRWEEIARIERAQNSVEFFGAGMEPLLNISLLEGRARQTILEQAVARASLKRLGTKPGYPVVEAWGRQTAPIQPM